MNYAEIKYCDVANGAGVRTSLFVSGCRRGCPECFNQVAWDFAAGEPFTTDVEDKILASLDASYVDGLSVLGGEPLEPENQEVLAPFLERVKAAQPAKNIWLWSGFTWEQITRDEGRHVRTDDTQRILSCLDVLVDGPFVQAQKDLMLRFRGSANQRIIDVPASLEARTAVPWQDEALFSTRGW